MWLIHHISDSQKYNYNENIHVDNNKIKTIEIMGKKEKMLIVKIGKDDFSVSFKHIYSGTLFQLVS